MNQASAAEVRPSWLTQRRLRAHGLILALCLWSAYAVNMSTPGLRDRAGLIKGTDFLHFYTLGTLALTGRGDLLYNISAQTELVGKQIPEAAGTIYVPLYGPQVSLLFAPLAKLPYGSALAAWLLLNTLIYASCCYALWRICPNLRDHAAIVAILALAFPGFFHLIAWGQTSGLALACFTLAYLAFRKKYRWLAGAAIGCLIFKPQLGIAAAVVFIGAAEWKVVAGAITAAAVQLAAAWLHYGSSIMQNYARALRHLREVMPLLEPRPYQMHSLRAFWSLLLPWHDVAFGAYLMTAAAVLALAVSSWRRQASLEIRFSVLSLATVLVSPHLTVYDLVVLAPVFLFVTDRILEPSSQPLRWLPALLYACYPLFLLGPLAQFTHLQFSVIAMATLLWLSASEPGSLRT